MRQPPRLDLPDDALLANTAAALARQRADTAREVLADERQSTAAAAPIAA